MSRKNPQAKDAYGDKINRKARRSAAAQQPKAIAAGPMIERPRPCSFCDARSPQAIFHGPGRVAICGDCVGLINDIWPPKPEWKLVEVWAGREIFTDGKCFDVKGALGRTQLKAIFSSLDSARRCAERL